MKKYTCALGFDDARHGWGRNGRGARAGAGVRGAGARASRVARGRDGCGAGGRGSSRGGLNLEKLNDARALECRLTDTWRARSRVWDMNRYVTDVCNVCGGLERVLWEMDDDDAGAVFEAFRLAASGRFAGELAGARTEVDG